VFYPFHPLHSSSLQIVRRPRRGDGAVSVIDSTGRRLKIPSWMLSPDSARIKIAERGLLSGEALRGLASLLAPFLDAESTIHDNLLQTALDGCQGGHRAARTTAGPDSTRGATHARDGHSAKRTRGSHGAPSGGGISNQRRRS